MEGFFVVRKLLYYYDSSYILYFGNI